MFSPEIRPIDVEGLPLHSFAEAEGAEYICHLGSIVELAADKVLTRWNDRTSVRRNVLILLSHRHSLRKIIFVTPVIHGKKNVGSRMRACW